MAKNDDGGPAFPTGVCTVDGNGNPLYPSEMKPFSGMTLRDYFAAQAVIGIMSTSGAFDRADRRAAMVARTAYEFADAMIEAAMRNPIPTEIIILPPAESCEPLKNILASLAVTIFGIGIVIVATVFA